MQVSLRVLGEVEVNDNVDSLDVDTSGEEICSKSNLRFISSGFSMNEEEKVLIET